MKEFMENISPELLKKLDGNLKTIEKVYESSLDLLRKKKLSDVAINSGSEIEDDGKIIVDFFEDRVVVDVGSGKVYYRKIKLTGQKDENQVDILSSSIILNYLNTADGAGLSGQWISYRELPGGMFYSRTITGVMEPLLKKYEDSSELLIKKMEEHGGHRSKEFKQGAVIYAFPVFPILVILEEKSEEFDAAIRALFDRNSYHYAETYTIKLILICMVRLLLS
jgi:hypothetical protein